MLSEVKGDSNFDFGAFGVAAAVVEVGGGDIDIGVVFGVDEADAFCDCVGGEGGEFGVGGSEVDAFIFFAAVIDDGGGEAAYAVVGDGNADILVVVDIGEDGYILDLVAVGEAVFDGIFGYGLDNHRGDEDAVFECFLGDIVYDGDAEVGGEADAFYFEVEDSGF